MTIEYKINQPITTKQFIELLNSSTLGERRPVDDRDCIEGMLANSNLVVTAWGSVDKSGEEKFEKPGKLVGIARCMTDFHYACYLSDLAVSESNQTLGIGKQLQRLVQQQLGPRCKLILIAAPAAQQYYEQIGFTQSDRCWVLPPGSSITG